MKKTEIIKYLQDLHDNDASLNDNQRKAISEAIREIKKNKTFDALIILVHILDAIHKIRGL